MARAVLDLEPPVAELEQLAVVQRPGHLRLGAPGPEAAGHLAQGGDDLLGDPVSPHQRGRLLVVALGVVAEVLDEGDEQVKGRNLRARALGDDVDQPEVVDVLVGDDHQLDVLDPVAESLELAVELVQRLAGIGARVDQREGPALEQVGVDAADLEGSGDPENPDAGVGDPLPDLDGRLLRHERIRPSTSSRFSSMCSGETSDSRLRRRSGSVLEGRTLKCQSG